MHHSIRPPLHLEQIKLTNFKNYTSQELLFSERINCIVGRNGIGKTNILDAIYYLCMCKSRFSGTDRNVVRQNESEKAEFFRLEGRFRAEDRQLNIAAKVIPGKSKVFECNGTAYERLIDHVGRLPVVFIAPDDVNLLLEGSESRRILMDNVLSQMYPDYLQNLVTYNRVLRQRNALLKQFAERGRFDADLLRTYNLQLAEPATRIHEFRKAYVERINPIFRSFYRTISGNREALACTYRSHLSNTPVEDLLLQSEEKDRVLARTTKGIHRDDLDFGLEDLPLKRFASQGQLKSFVITIKLAQFALLRDQKKEKPVLLLDDIFDKLDDHRVSNLLGLLAEKEYGQLFLTDTHEERAENIIRRLNQHYKKFLVADEGITEQEGS